MQAETQIQINCHGSYKNHTKKKMDTAIKLIGGFVEKIIN